jgi:predicted RNase H-like HicB family nuclease
MKKVQKRVHRFTVMFEPDPDGGYVVYVPALPGCATQGRTYEEAAKNAKEAIEGYVAAKKALKEEIVLESGEAIMARVPAQIS